MQAAIRKPAADKQAERALHDGAAAQSLHIAEREWSNVSAAFAKAAAGQVVRREMKHGFAV